MMTAELRHAYPGIPLGRRQPPSAGTVSTIFFLDERPGIPGVSGAASAGLIRRWIRLPPGACVHSYRLALDESGELIVGRCLRAGGGERLRIKQ